VLGIDVKPMTRPLSGVEFVEADIRNPLLSELFKVEKVDAIVHCAFRWRQRRAEEVFDSNVLGTMRLLGAASMAGVRKVVVPSSTVVYGAVADNPMFIDERDGFRGGPDYAYVQELREIETFINGFRRQQPDMVITTLRFANILGDGYPSPLARYLALPVAPVLIGFEPMLQVIHHDDVLRALGHCIMNDYNGIYNIAAAPAMPLLKLLALAQIPPAPLFHLFAAKGIRWARMFSKKVENAAPFPWDYLRYSWTVSTDRMSEELGFEPLRDAEATVHDFGEALRSYRYKHSRSYRFGYDRWRDLQGGGEIIVNTTHRTRAAVGESQNVRSE
jgi:UDP-glucose 4-epimerase